MNRTVLFSFGFAAVFACWLAAFGAYASQGAPGALANEDCVKCHPGPPADIEANGRGHQKVSCTDCHAGHPPTVKKPIPLCSQCHDAKPHYKLANCLGCHTNPHTPLKVTLKGEMSDPCVSCHQKPGKQMKENPSKHSLQACTACHTMIHRTKPECVKCHKPHGNIAQKNCGVCHQAHMPKAVAYGDVSSSFCAPCHKPVFDLLNASETKHRLFSCAYCHKAKHRMIPKCQDCHKKKHSRGIIAKFKGCIECHKSPHDLNNWPDPEGAKEKEKEKAAPKNVRKPK